MIKLYQYPPFWNMPNASPFCMKLETYLRMTKIPFTIVAVTDPRKAPKGKLPCIKDDGKKIADSSFIITYLKHKYGDSLDANLSSKQKAQAMALQRLMEEHLYWAIVYSRWIVPTNWDIIKKAFFGEIPTLIRPILSFFIQRKIRRDLYGQGLGRHSAEEIFQLGIDDLNTLNVTLSDQPFLLGNEPTSIDACGYAFLAAILQPPLPSPLQEYVKSQPPLIAYCTRMKELFYP